MTKAPLDGAPPEAIASLVCQPLAASYRNDRSANNGGRLAVCCRILGQRCVGYTRRCLVLRRGYSAVSGEQEDVGTGRAAPSAPRNERNCQ